MTRTTYTTLFIILAGLVFVAGGFWLNSALQEQAQKETRERFAYLQSGGQCLKLEVANTPEKRRQGLSGRQQLKSNEGMLFTYNQSGRYGFWMKDMDFSIDIIWVNESDRIITIKKRAEPSSYPQTFRPDRPAKKVIETTAGWAEMQNLKTGNQLSLVAPTTTTPGGCESN